MWNDILMAVHLKRITDLSYIEAMIGKRGPGNGLMNLGIY
jgi:hypothetical protein